ncbi:MAG: hypothetical protein IJ091_09920, partial [Oscillospiraceae bacterium]|nr:hypothetical protein [Oscillospiraceae bacterium]
SVILILRKLLSDWCQQLNLTGFTLLGERLAVPPILIFELFAYSNFTLCAVPKNRLDPSNLLLLNS